MPSPLEEMETALDMGVVDHLGDTIFYSVASATALELRAFLDFSDDVIDTGTTGVVTQQMQIEINCADLPGRPGDGDRITFAKRPGETFKPAAAQLSRSGTTWLCRLVKVPG